MCGIFGTVNTSGLTSQNKVQFNKFFELQHHRGPDGKGRYEDDKAVFGIVRLSIIDIEHGSQPLWSSDKSIGVIANGEIYNHIELRNELKLAGHTFETLSDIEVIIHLYEEHGYEFVKHLRGMFAFALIDKKENQIILGRDRMGEKPLYIAETESGFSFSSELRTLIQTGTVPLNFNSQVIPNYFLYGFVPEPLTFIKGIRKVAAGTIEIFSLSTNERSVQTYWKMGSTQEVGSQQPAQELKKLLDEVGQLIIRSDVPIGIALSGGIDSAIIASIITEHNADIHSFTVGYKGKHASDESNDAVELAKSLGITAHVIKLDTEEIADRFEQLCLMRDEPVADVAGSSYLAVAELAQSFGVKVLLSGQGADELFWGYPWVRNVAYWANRRSKTLFGSFQIRDYLKVRIPLRRKGELIDWLTDFGGLKENFKQFEEDRNDGRMLNRQILMYERRPRARRIRKISNSLLAYPPHFVPAHSQNPLNEKDSSSQVLKILAHTYLQSNGLLQMDRLGMCASVETRTPFIDHKIVEFAFRENEKSNSYYLQPKSLLIQAVKDLVPAEILNRPKKGFTPPVKDWYKAIYAKHKQDFKQPRIVELGLVTENAIKILNKPLSFIGRTNVLWLELAVLELWVRGIEKVATPRD